MKLNHPVIVISRFFRNMAIDCFYFCIRHFSGRGIAFADIDGVAD